MGLRAAEAANMWHVQSLSAADGIMSVTAHNALCLVLAQTCACAREHASIPRATVLLENTHLHPSYKVAVVTRAFQPLIDESRPNKRLRRSNPGARFMAPKATRFLPNLPRQNRSAIAKRAANGDLAATAVAAVTSAKGAPARCDGGSVL